MTETLGVADAKRRFSELIERVRGGERFLVVRRGKPAVALVPPEVADQIPDGKPVGLAGIAGALADWNALDDVISEIYASRRRARDRAVADLE